MYETPTIIGFSIGVEHDANPARYERKGWFETSKGQIDVYETPDGPVINSEGDRKLESIFDYYEGIKYEKGWIRITWGKHGFAEYKFTWAKDSFDWHAEQCYRRGFYQGLVACQEAFESEIPWEEIHSWRERVHYWRVNRENHMEKVYPEWLARDEWLPKERS
tara:strand:- start:94 stop:582 length:489 start_codon:yes stop_codon:yes gene_type:complete